MSAGTVFGRPVPGGLSRSPSRLLNRFGHVRGLVGDDMGRSGGGLFGLVDGVWEMAAHDVGRFGRTALGGASGGIGQVDGNVAAMPVRAPATSGALSATTWAARVAASLVLSMAAGRWLLTASAALAAPSWAARVVASPQSMAIPAAAPVRAPMTKPFQALRKRAVLWGDPRNGRSPRRPLWPHRVGRRGWCCRPSRWQYRRRRRLGRL